MRVGPNEYTTEFTRVAFFNSEFPNKMLVMYDGDESVAKDFPHGNAKHPEKTEKSFYNSKKSLLTEMKTYVMDKLPLKVYSDLILAKRANK